MSCFVLPSRVKRGFLLVATAILFAVAALSCSGDGGGQPAAPNNRGGAESNGGSGAKSNGGSGAESSGGSGGGGIEQNDGGQPAAKTKPENPTAGTTPEESSASASATTSASASAAASASASAYHP
jgi:hypothetical protein